jgi:hypothetical protein
VDLLATFGGMFCLITALLMVLAAASEAVRDASWNGKVLLLSFAAAWAGAVAVHWIVASLT